MHFLYSLEHTQKKNIFSLTVPCVTVLGSSRFQLLVVKGKPPSARASFQMYQGPAQIAERALKEGVIFHSLFLGKAISVQRLTQSVWIPDQGQYTLPPYEQIW